MVAKLEANEVAAALRVGVGTLVRRLKKVQPIGGLSSPEASALARLDREGPSTSGDLAKLEHITPQSMGTTLAALEARGLIARRADPSDGRRAVLSLTRAGRDTVLRRRDGTTALIARALDANFTAAEIAQLHAAAALLERLALAL